MKQKIEVQVTAAVDEQWPKASSLSNHYPEGSEYYVVCVGKALHSYKIGEGGYPDIGMGHFFTDQQLGIVGNLALFFPNWGHLIAWLNNPHPVKTGTLSCTFRSLDMGAIFLHESNVFIVSEPYANNQARGFGWAVCPKIGAATLFYPDNEVVPLYGTITINVGRDAE